MLFPGGAPDRGRKIPKFNFRAASILRLERNTSDLVHLEPSHFTSHGTGQPKAASRIQKEHHLLPWLITFAHLPQPTPLLNINNLSGTTPRIASCTRKVVWVTAG